MKLGSWYGSSPPLLLSLSLFFVPFFFDTESSYITLTDLELTILMNMTSLSYSHFYASSYQMLQLHTDTTSPTLHLIWFVIPKNLCPAKFSRYLLIIWENTQDCGLFLINGDKLMDGFQKGLPWDRQSECRKLTLVTPAEQHTFINEASSRARTSGVQMKIT